MIFPYSEPTYGMEGMWDSATELGNMNFPYRERETYEELAAARRRANVAHTLPAIAVEFINLEQDLIDNPEELLGARTKLCVVTWQHAIPFIPSEYSRVLAGFGFARTGTYPTEQEYYKAKVNGHLRKASGVIRNYYLSAMIRQNQQTDTS